MLCGKVFDRFVAKTPVTVMLRGVLERVLAPEPLDQLFAATAERQYTRELLFSSTVDLMAAVACRIYPAVHAAYQDDKARIGVSVRALYDKLAHMEPALGEELVRHTASQLKPLLRQMRATLPPLVDGYTTKILDGNHLGASERRLKELRMWPQARCRARRWWCWNPSTNWPPRSSAAKTAMPKSGRSWAASWNGCRPTTCGWPTGTSAPPACSSVWPAGRRASSSANTRRRCSGSGKANSGGSGGSRRAWSTSNGYGWKTVRAKCWWCGA